ncbi:MAG: Gfo/Idh/MocA family oxidoreductase [Candidatus Latescibacterota bacterium]
MSQKLRFGLVGCGDFGKYIGRYFLEKADIVALCDVNAAGMETTAEALALDVPCHTDYRALFAAGGLDAVIVTAANFVHAEITVAAAEAGLHVFCEKAMARNVPECWAMVRACQKHDVKLMVGHKRRLRTPWARMLELTDEAMLGEVLAVSVTQYADYRPYGFFDRWWADPKLSGGFFQMHGVHVIDWFRALCGNAKRVTALYGPQQDPRYQYPDIVHATFQFESGALASLNGSLLFPLHKFREAQGPWAQCRNGGFKLVPEMDHIDLHWQRLDEEEPHHERFDDLGFDHAYRLEVGDFVRWIQEDRPPCLTWLEGLRCVEMMEAGYRSAESGGQPIELPLYPELEGETL